MSESKSKSSRKYFIVSVLCIFLGTFLGAFLGFTAKEVLAAMKSPPPAPDGYKLPKIDWAHWEFPSATQINSSIDQITGDGFSTYVTSEPIEAVWAHFAKLAGIEDEEKFSPATIAGGTRLNTNVNRYGSSGGKTYLNYYTGDIERESVQTALISLSEQPGYDFTVMITSGKDEDKTYITLACRTHL